MAVTTVSATSRPPVWDRAGIAASALCVTHCVATPLVATALPILAATEEGTHLALTLTLLLIGLLAFLPGRRSHGSSRPLGLAIPGFAMLGGALALPEAIGGESLETVLTIAGGALLISAHLCNIRLCRRCQACAGPGCGPARGRSSR
jgi:hypothetical protein